MTPTLSWQLCVPKEEVVFLELAADKLHTLLISSYLTLVSSSNPGHVVPQLQAATQPTVRQALALS